MQYCAELLFSTGSSPTVAEANLPCKGKDASLENDDLSLNWKGCGQEAQWPHICPKSDSYTTAAGLEVLLIDGTYLEAHILPMLRAHCWIKQVSDFPNLLRGQESDEGYNIL